MTDAEQQSGTTVPEQKSRPRTLAAVDLGSNSFHMVVARYEHGHLTLLDRIKEMVRLADGLDENDFLSEEAQDRALECLALFGERLNTFHPDDVVAVGTNTLRKAHNSEEFLHKAKQVLGHGIEIISGQEEARLVYIGAAHSIPPSSKRRLIVDIGGGSTELVIGRGYEAERLYSLFMGCVSLTRQCFPEGEITRDAVGYARLLADLEIVPVVEPLKALGWRRAYGTSGTARTIGRLHAELGYSEGAINHDGLKKLIDEMQGFGHVDEINWTSLQERRKPVLIGGVIIMERLFNALGIELMEISDYALREGVLYNLVGRWSGEDARDRSVSLLTRKYTVDAAQAERLEKVVLDLFRAVRKDWQLPKSRCRRLLGWSAQLHELGLSIAHSHYHRHGAYIVANADLPGFSREWQQRLAWLIEGHRRRIPDLPPMSSTSAWRDRLMRLLVLLRLAVVLVRSRSVKELPEVTATAGTADLHLQFKEGWLDSHPLTFADLQAEVRICTELGVALSFA